MTYIGVCLVRTLRALQSLEREASSLEARLAAARADLREADHVRASLDRLRDDDEVTAVMAATHRGVIESDCSRIST